MWTMRSPRVVVMSFHRGSQGLSGHPTPATHGATLKRREQKVAPGVHLVCGWPLSPSVLSLSKPWPPVGDRDQDHRPPQVQTWCGLTVVPSRACLCSPPRGHAAPSAWWLLT